jgi:hypothetical protein
LKILNDDLNAKLEVVNKSSPCVEHVVICNRCKDFNVDAYDEHLISISKLNDEVASLNAQLKTCKSDFDKLKFARDAYTVGRHPSIKDSLVRHRTVSGAPATSPGRWVPTVGALTCGPAWLSGGAPDKSCRLSGVPPARAGAHLMRCSRPLARSSRCSAGSPDSPVCTGHVR